MDAEDREFRSGEALFAFDAELEILSWNAAAEKLTGISAEEAVGRRCWEVLRGVDERWAAVCHAGCLAARHAREGWPVPEQRLLAKTRRGRRLVALSTIAVRGGHNPVFLHVMRSGHGPERRSEPLLTPREREVLALLAEGVPTKVIAAQLEVAEATVRRHIQAILRKLDARPESRGPEWGRPTS